MLRSYIKTISILAALPLIAVACAKETGVKARIQERANNTPDVVAQRSANMLVTHPDNQNKSSSASNISSQAIRSDTLGFRVKMTAKQDGTSDLRVEHFEAMAGGKCRNTTHNMTVTNSSLASSWHPAKTMSMRCYDADCNYMIIVLQASGNTYMDGNGQLANAFVPLVLEKKTESSGVYYKPTAMVNPEFLKLPSDMNTICNPSDEVVQFNNQYVISPIDNGTSDPNYDYFPDPYNNSWYY